MSDDELKRLFDVLREESAAMRQDQAAMRQDQAAMRQENAAMHVETRRLFEVTAEGLHHEIGLIAEKVLRIDEKLDRELTTVRQEMRTGFAETQAMFKFSHVELDRRIRSLEESKRTFEDALSDLQSRIERLEGSTH